MRLLKLELCNTKCGPREGERTSPRLLESGNIIMLVYSCIQKGDNLANGLGPFWA